MLLRKMFRELRKDWAQALSIFLLSFLAVAMYCTMEGHVIAQEHARGDFHAACNLADIWIYGEGFTQEDLEAVRELDFVKDAQLRTSITGSAPDCDGAQVDLYLESENLVNKPYYIEGEEFDPDDTTGIWLTNAFAELRDIQVGDEFTIEYNGITFTRTVRGLIESAEYEFRQAEGDADIYLENIAFVYMSYDEQLAQSIPLTQMVVKTKDGSALSREKEISEALNQKYAAMVDKSSIPGIARLDSELDQHETFSYFFVIIFAGIAILVIATSVSRLVERQRTQVGTMNALGMRRYKVFLHYMGNSFFVSLLGVAVGILVGSYVLSPIMVDLFAGWYIVPGLQARFDISYIMIGTVVVLACTLSSYVSCRKILRIKPAQALRPAPPKNGKHCIFEKLPFWNRLGFYMQYNLRDISRAKLRTGMCVLGTTVGMILMVYAVACNFLVDDLIALTYEKVQPANWQMKLSEEADLSELDMLSEKVSGELVMMSQIEVSKQAAAVSTEKQQETIIVLEEKGHYNLLDTKQKVVSLKPGQIGVSRKLSEDMDIEIGDEIYWHLYSKNDWHKATVGCIYHNSEIQGIAYLREDYEKTGEDFVPLYLFSDENLQAYEKEDYVISVSSKQSMRDALVKSYEVISILVGVMLVFSVVLIVVVLYNSGNLSFHERIRELATLKVLGMQSGKIRTIMSVQNFWLSLVGILIGAPLGKMSVNSMMNSNGDNFDYALTIQPWCYLVSAVLVLTVSVSISFFFSNRIKRLDMVEVLKGVE